MIKPFINKDIGISKDELVGLFYTYPKNAQSYLSGKFTEIPIANIEANRESISLHRFQRFPT